MSNENIDDFDEKQMAELQEYLKAEVIKFHIRETLTTLHDKTAEMGIGLGDLEIVRIEEIAVVSWERLLSASTTAEPIDNQWNSSQPIKLTFTEQDKRLFGSLYREAILEAVQKVKAFSEEFC
tara:strand:+ start:33 stop:401 length:369 start_codon:yes stop_codon:yes gene_type:complete